MQSKAKTVDEYLESLPDERRDAIARLRQVILDHLQPGFEERMQYGMIGYCVPLSGYPRGYLNDPTVPLPYIGLASQKNYMSLYLMCLYCDEKLSSRFESAYKDSEKKLNMGKSCVRFKRIGDLPLDVIGQAVGAMTVKDVIASYQKHKEK